MSSFKDSTVLITGANNPLGIGAETARAFASRGAKVAVTYLRLAGHEDAQETKPGLPFYQHQRAKSADEVVDSIKQAKGRVIAREADLGNPDAATALLDWVEAELGPIDILINNAAHYEAQDTIFGITAEGIDRTFSINMRAAILLAREFAVRHRRRGATRGRIINLSTDAAQSFAGQISYGASKAAIESATRSIAAELGPLGITVNAVAPGPVQTGYITTEAEQRLAQAIPLRRIGTTADIANAIMFLTSPDADWTTGQVLRVSGGHVF